MKFRFFLLIALLSATVSVAQDTVNKRNWLSNNVLERYKILKGNPGKRVGAYRAFFKRRTLIASGQYSDGKKSGLWSFFDQDGQPSQTYDYDNSQFISEAPIDTTNDISYAFDLEQLKPEQRPTKPLRVGGVYYGFIPYVNTFKLPFDTAGINTGFFGAVIELLVSPGGRLAYYKVHLFSKAYRYKQSFNMDVNLFAEEDKVFFPATLDHRPILSRIFIKCVVDDDGSLDFY